MNMQNVPLIPTQTIDIHEKLMVIRLNCSFGMANVVTDKQLTEEINGDKKTKGLRVQKELFPGDIGKYLKALRAKLSEFYAYHIQKTMDSVNDGERLIPTAFILDYDYKFGEYEKHVRDAFDEFRDHYDNCVLQVKYHAEYGKTFNPNDYPAKDRLEGLLKFKRLRLSLPKASVELLNVVGAAVQSDHDIFMQQALESAFADVNLRVRKGLERMVEQLSDPKKKVYDSLTGSMQELVNMIPAFNVTQDDSLTLLAEEIKEKILYANPDILRHDEVIRRNVAEEAKDILRRMGG